MDRAATAQSPEALVGIGLYTPAEAEKLVQVSASKIVRWLRGHAVQGRAYGALWAPQVDLGDDHIYLGFRDLMEVRVANAFIQGAGLSPQKVRRAIDIARDLIGDERPLSTARFRTDGRSVFTQVAAEDGEPKLIDLLKKQYTFRNIIEPTLKTIEFDDGGLPARWWPLGPAARIVVDPARSFGQPIEVETSIPADILAAAAKTEGSVAKAAQVWGVPANAIRRAVAFQADFHMPRAA